MELSDISDNFYCERLGNIKLKIELLTEILDLHVSVDYADMYEKDNSVREAVQNHVRSVGRELTEWMS